MPATTRLDLPSFADGDVSVAAEVDAVLNAAVAEFLSKGYEGANLRAIVAASGRSTGDVYRRFGNKQNLFREVIKRHADLSLPRSAKLRVTGRAVEEELAEFAIAFLTEFLDPAMLAIFRMVVSEAALIPDVVRRLWEIGPQKAVAQVEAYLIEQQAAGRVMIDDPHLAAAQFLDMIRAGMHVRAQMAGIAPTRDEIERSARQAAGIFARGVRPALYQAGRPV